MKLSIFLFAFVLLNVQANTYSQNKKISIHVDNESIAQVLERIEAKSQISFFYKTGEIDVTKKVSLNKVKTPIKDILDLIFNDGTVTYTVLNKHVILKRSVVDDQPVSIIDKTDELAVQRKIKGKVTDESNLPLGGVTIIIDGTTKGTTTDFDGNFNITIGPGAVLEFSYLGFLTQKFRVPSTEDTLNVVMVESAAQLDEVIVSTGYYNIAKERATGSFTKVDVKEIDRQVTTNIVNRLEAVVPGLLTDVTVVDGETKTNLILRGVSSFQAGFEPLIVVDGFPIEGGLESINPNDIESINILQDAAATSIWGVRASNGVIVITTKRGREGKMEVEFSSFVSFISKPNLNNLDTADSGTLVDVAHHFADKSLDTNIGTYNPSPSAINVALNPVSAAYVQMDQNNPASVAAYQAKLAQFRQTDVYGQYEDLLMRTGVGTQHNLSIRTGSERNSLFFSASLNEETSYMIGDKNQRQILNLKDDFKLTKDLTFSVGANFSLYRTENNSDGLGVLDGSANDFSYTIPRFQLLQDGQGNQIPISRTYTFETNDLLMSRGYLDNNYYPLNEVKNRDITTNRFNLRLQGGLRYEVLDGLGVEVKGQYEFERFKRENYGDLNTFSTINTINAFTGYNAATGQLTYNVPFGGILDSNESDLKAYYVRGFADYNKTFAEKHHVSALIGTEITEREIEFRTDRFLGYNEQNANYNSNINWSDLSQSMLTGTTPLPRRSMSNPSNIDASVRRLVSTFGNLAYTYDGKYTLSGSFKGDQSNRVGEQNLDPNYLWSAGAAWNINREGFMDNVDFVNSLKLRGSYGVSGNIHENASSLPILTSGSNFNTGEADFRLTSFGNLALTFEDTFESNIGLDFGLFNNRLSGSLEYYNERSKNVLADFALPATLGFTTVLLNNGEILNKGVSVNLNADIIKTKNFSWSSNFNITHNDNEVITYELSSSSPTSLILSLGGITPNSNHLVGEPVGTILSYRFAGLDDLGKPQAFDADGSVLPYVGGAISGMDALEVSGTTIAPTYGGFNNTFNYKGFSLNVLMSFKTGHIFRRPSVFFRGNSFDNLDVHKDAANRFIPGVNEDTNVPSLPNTNNEVISLSNYFYSLSDILVEDASFVRLRQISLGYSLPASVLKVINVDNVSFTAQAQNLGLIWSANDYDIDPEAIPYAGNVGNVQRGQIKPEPTFVFGVNIQF